MRTDLFTLIVSLELKTFRHENIVSIKFWLEIEWSCWGLGDVRGVDRTSLLLYKHPALGSVLEHVRASQGSLLVINIGMLHKGEEYVFAFS